MMLLKINFLLRVNSGFGLLVTLVKTAMTEMASFTLYFAIWLCTFVLLYKVTGQTAKGRKGFEDNSFFNYLILVFENSIGNIEDPTYNESKHFVGSSSVYILWGVWWFNQFMVVIILLNFLIAVISQSYENVMNSSTILKFKDIAQLNREAYMILQFLGVKMIYTNQIIMTIPDEENVENKEEGWTGFVQALKQYIKIHVTTKVKAVSANIAGVEQRLTRKFEK